MRQGMRQGLEQVHVELGHLLPCHVIGRMVSAMHKAAATTATIAFAIVASIAVTITLVIAMLAAPAPSSTVTPVAQAPCTTDVDCEAWALEQGMDTTPTLEPADDGGEGYVCPAGMDLYDTEMPELGAQGVVCRTHLMEV